MDFHGLKRKQLQGLCKKHGIPANIKNFEMADRLSSLLKVEIPKKRGRPCLNKLGVVGDAEVLSKEPKRVKFSPQNETCIFEKTDPLQLRSMVRKERAFEKSQLEQKPVLVGGIVDDSSDNNVDLGKVAKRNQRVNSGARVAEDYCLFRSPNKDDGEGGTEPSSINTFLLRLESLVDDTMKVLCGPLIERDNCDQETLQGDIASTPGNEIPGYTKCNKLDEVLGTEFDCQNTEGLCSREPMPLESVEEIKDDMVDTDVDKSNASSSERLIEVVPQALVSKVDGGSESFYRGKESEISSAMEMKLHVDTEGNCDNESEISSAMEMKLHVDTEGNCDNASLNLMVEKKEVKTLQPEASDAAFSVNEYEIENVEIDCERQERAKDSVGEVGNSEKSRNVEEDKNLCFFDANNLGKVVERFKDLVSQCHLWF